MYLKSFKNIIQFSTKGDRILLFSLMLLSITGLFINNHLRHPGKSVMIEMDGQLIQKLSLYSNYKITVKGHIGETVVEIANGKALILKSDCPHKICVRTGAISRAGDVLVCIPNKVVVRISNGDNISYDAVTGMRPLHEGKQDQVGE